MKEKNETVRLLVLHDSQDNAEQIVNALKNTGIATRPELINNETDLEEAINERSWDILLIGESTKGISYHRALELIKTAEKDIPAIVLLADYDPDMLVEVLKAGATDSVVYNSHKELVLVIKRELNNLWTRRARRLAEASLAETEKRCELLLDNSRDAIAYVHDGMHIYINASYTELFGYDDPDDLEGLPIVDLVAKEDLVTFKDYLRSYSKGERISEDLKFRGVKADNSKIDAMIQLSAATYDGEPCTQIIIRRNEGAANSAELAAKLKEATSIDALTGLPNRQRFEEAVVAAIRKAQSDKIRFGLFYFTLDNFTQISAAHGLKGSDAIIRSLANLLSKEWQGAITARFGDSTFTAIVPNLDPEKAKIAGENFCKKVHEHLFELPEGKTQQTSLSIGISLIGETTTNPNELMSRAIESAEKVKTAGGNNVLVFNPAEKAGSSDSALFELLIDALENSKFKLLYQPLVDVEGSSDEFYEVFVRLPLADGKTMTPDEFMSVAAKHQLGIKIDRWVMLNAAKELKEHTKASPKTRMLLNLTAESLQDPTLAAWISKLSRAISPTRQPLMLQFSETDVVTYLKAAKTQTQALTEAGCPVSICQFGTTLNPINTLQHVTVSHIKLDRSFTQDLSNEENLNNMKKIVSELSSQEKKIIVPFVENAQTLSKLWTIGVHLLQGYYLQPPSDTMHYESNS